HQVSMRTFTRSLPDPGAAGRSRIALLAVSSPPDDDVEALDEALSKLTVEQPQIAELVQLWSFGGLTLAQCAHVLGVSEPHIVRRRAPVNFNSFDATPKLSQNCEPTYS